MAIRLYTCKVYEVLSILSYLSKDLFDLSKPRDRAFKKGKFDQSDYFDKGPLDDAPCPTSKLKALWFQSWKSLKYSLCKPLYIKWTLGWDQ